MSVGLFCVCSMMQFWKNIEIFGKLLWNIYSVPNYKSNADLFHQLALGPTWKGTLQVYLISERRSASCSAFRLTFQFREREVYQRSLKVILIPYMLFIRSDNYYNLELLVFMPLLSRVVVGLGVLFHRPTSRRKLH